PHDHPFRFSARIGVAMIMGRVSPDREAVIAVSVRGPTGRTLKTDAVIDTGFSDWLTLPSDQIEALELPWERRERASLADGTERFVDIYEAHVLWDQHSRRIAIAETETFPLAGMLLLEGYELMVEVVIGGRVTLRSLTGA
ncbi:MAG: hypothetical protein ACREJB_07345, partial [Planctomycetaceae bacterium]